MVDIDEKAFAAATILKKRESPAKQFKNQNHPKAFKANPINEPVSTNNISKVSLKKRKKKTKLTKFKKGVGDKVKTPKEKISVARLPQSSKDLSSNWKRLLQQMEEQNKKDCTKKTKKFTSNKSGDKIKKHGSREKNAISGHEENIKSQKPPEVWFDDVDVCLLDQNEDGTQNCETTKDPLIKNKSFNGITKAIAMDCEMVGVGYKGDDSVLARVSLVNQFGHCVYDKYVKPREKVTDYRTAVSGIRAEDIQNANDFKVVQKEVSDILNNRILIGHAIRHDLKVLFLDHPRRMIRDTSAYKPFRAAFGGRTPSLKNLSARMLGVTVQQGEHSSVQDAQATMRLYTMFKKDWEKELNKRKGKPSSGLKNTNSEHSDIPPVIDIQSKKHLNNETRQISNFHSDLKRSNQLEYEDSD